MAVEERVSKGWTLAVVRDRKGFERRVKVELPPPRSLRFPVAARVQMMREVAIDSPVYSSVEFYYVGLRETAFGRAALYEER